MKINVVCNECSCRKVCKYADETKEFAKKLESGDLKSPSNISTIELKCDYFVNKCNQMCTIDVGTTSGTSTGHPLLEHR